MIWLKRLLPLVLIVAGWMAYTKYQQHTAELFYDDAERYALVTAQVWLASAEYRDDPQQFLNFRDSLLEATGLSLEKVDEYLERYSKRPETYTPYLRLVKQYVDSLTQPMTDSLCKPGQFRVIDSMSIE